MFLIALFAPVVLAEDWPPNATINEAASLQVTPEGLDAVSDDDQLLSRGAAVVGTGAAIAAGGSSRKSVDGAGGARGCNAASAGAAVWPGWSLTVVSLSCGIPTKTCGQSTRFPRTA